MGKLILLIIIIAFLAWWAYEYKKSKKSKKSNAPEKSNLSDIDELILFLEKSILKAEVDAERGIEEAESKLVNYRSQLAKAKELKEKIK